MRFFSGNISNSLCGYFSYDYSGYGASSGKVKESYFSLHQANIVFYPNRSCNDFIRLKLLNFAEMI